MGTGGIGSYLAGRVKEKAALVKASMSLGITKPPVAAPEPITPLAGTGAPDPVMLDIATKFLESL